ncbi:MAG: hypothetical protein J6D18_00490 [Erysipelotrichaceae bacterium]|nr:hypothetical protein [Erysipelotrichaceae bacterium]
MKFDDIDFSAISNLINNLSEEEKEDMMNMAQNMMQNMDGPIPEVPEEETDFYTQLNIDAQQYAHLPDAITDDIENAVDLEDYYDQDPQADYSASVLFYAKAVLFLLRKEHAPHYEKILGLSQFAQPQTTTLPMYYPVLTDDANLQTLADADTLPLQDWVAHRQFLQQLVTFLSKAEYDRISYDELQALKQQLFQEKGLLRIIGEA